MRCSPSAMLNQGPTHSKRFSTLACKVLRERLPLATSYLTFQRAVSCNSMRLFPFCELTQERIRYKCSSLFVTPAMRGALENDASRNGIGALRQQGMALKTEPPSYIPGLNAGVLQGL